MNGKASELARRVEVTASEGRSFMMGEGRCGWGEKDSE